ncbi:hypothetical protein [Shinella sp.]|uniref:hypothetical protein n=1 Tax=Shinella sp. TaxID=1870904 RepID=UPI0028A64F69|nr:hypothetical protein [Shinella sp.]
MYSDFSNVDDEFTIRPALIDAAVNRHLPNSGFGIAEIAGEQERRRRRLKGMTSRLHKTWSGLDIGRRGGACRMEWARLQAFLATEILPVFQAERGPLFLIKLSDKRWRVPFEEATSAVFISPAREVHKAIYSLRVKGYRPCCLTSYALTGVIEFDDEDNDDDYSGELFEPRAYILIGGVPNENILSAVFGMDGACLHAPFKIVPLPKSDAGKVLGYATKMRAETWWDFRSLGEKYRMWVEMNPQMELAWLRIMAETPITDLVEFEGFAKPLKLQFGLEKMAMLLNALIETGKG